MRQWVWRLGRLGLIMLALVGAGVVRAATLGGAVAGATRPTAFNPVAAPQTAGYLWFAATGHTLHGPFRAYWEAHGGLAQFGYPLSEAFDATLPGANRSYSVQYFERARFEFHPEIGGPAGSVVLGLLGSELTHGGTIFPTAAPFTTTAQDRYFPATHHALHGLFYAYWQAHGGQAIYGYPISEEILQQSAGNGRVYLVQYFQRNRLELHPEARSTAAEVQLGLLGSEWLRAQGWLP